MPSPALTAFHEAVDASSLGAAAKTAAKEWGRRLYLAAVREHAEHVRYHLAAEVRERPPSQEVTQRHAMIAAVLDRVRDAGESLALSIGEALDG